MLPLNIIIPRFIEPDFFIYRLPQSVREQCLFLHLFYLSHQAIRLQDTHRSYSADQIRPHELPDTIQMYRIPLRHLIKRQLVYLQSTF